MTNAEVIERARALQQQRRVDEALDLVDGQPSVLKRSDGLVLKGQLLGMKGRFMEARKAFEKAIKKNARDRQALEGAANAAFKLGQRATSIKYANRALAVAPDSSKAQMIRALCDFEDGRYELAEKAFSRILLSNPKSVAANVNIGRAKAKRGAHHDAIPFFRLAISLDPGSQAAHLNLIRSLVRTRNIGAAQKAIVDYEVRFGESVELLLEKVSVAAERGEKDEAIAAAQKVVSLDTSDEVAWWRLFVVCERFVDHDQMADVVARWRETQPASTLLEVATATLKVARKEPFEEAELDALESLTFRGRYPSNVMTYLTRTFDKLGAQRASFFRKAFKAAVAYKGIENTPAAAEGAAAYRSMYKTKTRSIVSYHSENTLEAPSDKIRSHPPLAFIMGFPRSGTTLLDTFLRGHTSVEVFEERPFLQKVESNLLMGRTLGDKETVDFHKALGDEYFYRIASLGESDIIGAQEAYFRMLHEHGEQSPEVKLYVDKMPLYAHHLSLINRILPSSKVIFTLRHPLDALTSCFLQSFHLNQAMASFLDLESTAELYDHVMEHWLTCRDNLDLNYMYSKYEELIDDPTSVLGNICNFVGLELTQDMLDHTQTAASRGRISTPSYSQVTQPIYKTSSGRWRNYEEELAPIIPKMEKWITEFGYEL